MEKITMTLIGLVFAFSANAQKLSMESPQPATAPEIKKAVLFDQSPSPDVTSGIVSTVNNTGAGVYSTDDFELTSENDITFITAFGFNQSENFIADVTGINVYVYANSDTNLPIGDPSQEGSGLLELVNINPEGPAIEFIQNGTGLDIRIDVAEALGSNFSLPAGNYWLVVAPSLDIPNFDGPIRWNWFSAGAGAAGVNEAHLIDPTDDFGGGLITWTAFSDIGLEFASVAFVIEGESSLSNSAFNSTDFTFYPNPVNDILSISTASTVDNLKVYNMLGQMVVETAPKASNPQVDMKELQSGVYLVTLEVEGSLQSFRVIKQ
jgi:hypothetical protein